MRYLIACMLIGLSAGYAQEAADPEVVGSPEVTKADEEEGPVATNGSVKLLQNQEGKKGCGCGKPK